MAIDIESITYARDGLEIVEYEAVADRNGGDTFLGFGGMQDGWDAVAIVELRSGAGEVHSDGFESDPSLSGGPARGFRYDADMGFGTVGLGLSLGPNGTARVFMGRVRRGAFAALRKTGCRLCRFVVRSLLRAALAAAGVPFPAVGDDLTAFAGSITAALDAMQQGQMNAALQSLAALVPQSVWEAMKQALHFANWIWDGIDKFCEAVCVALMICPAPPSPTPTP
jgi:hypothetical protein